ncbi:SusC/RagA family TonB-linked outer membrane protein [Dinghuibacter silviterrae]|uniref:TonB-linked SusC/RagA family outer membrane protein n=1 Tax=Dinghuibacter silviterrae TaxID=1539049 RepID=A0A4R8DS38_9BACT|nr:SusC/RagA family TonB-linked outer membrane protein [Dinghuibacter silviterrae]TDX00829.1 TonB-linked SusC/RagA family outer membrane protein [Dinghuibacter silviterrae]
MSQKLTLTAALFTALLLCLLTGSPVSAQDLRVGGKIVSSGAPLAGATVTEKGTKHSTLTDVDGNFSLEVSNLNVTLVVSYVGFTTQEIPLSGRNSISVALIPSGQQLQDVVVTALGISKEAKTIGYATSTVKGNDLIKAREPDVFNSLEGKVSGLTIGSSPELLGRPEIVMRGTKDILIVVDGIPINSDTWNVNADDIESTTVLKGPNAAALYGFQGQNGAIVITTKRGSRDSRGWQVSFNSSTMIEKGFTVIPKDQTEYGRGSNFTYSYGDQLYDYGQRLAVWGPRFEGQKIKQYDSPWDPTTGTRTATNYTARGVNNLQHFLQAGILSTNNVSASAGGSNYDIRMSYSHIYQKGQAPNTGLNMDNLNINTTYSVSPKIRFHANLNLNEQYTPNIPDVDYGPNSYVYMFNVYGPADYDVRDLKNYYKAPMGVPGLTQYNENYGRSNNPYFMAYQWLRGHYKTDIYGYIKLTYNITPELNASIRTQITTWDQTRTEKVPAGTILNQYLSWYYPGWYGDYREDDRKLLENNTDVLLSYNKKFSDWTIGANAGANERSYKYNSSFTTTKDLSVPGVYSFTNSQLPVLAYNFGSNMQVNSAYYSVDLGYKSYVNLSTTGRVDHLSTLPSGTNTFFYPSVSLSTSIGDYVKLPKAFDLLKLRGSYADVKGGLTSSQIGSAYSALYGTTLNSGLLGYGSELYSSYNGPSYANQSAYSITTYYNGEPAVSYSSNIANPKLKSYDVQSFEEGLDLSMFRHRVGLDVTYFQTKNGPQIFPLGVASSTGYTSQNVNAVTTLKKGWEADLALTPIRTAKFTWDVNLNWSTYRETLKKVYGSLNHIVINNHDFHVGDRMDAFYSTAFVRDGSGNIVYQYAQNTQTGNGDPLQAPSDIGDKKLLGYLNPKYTWGINNRFTYKSFSLSFQFDGRVGGVIYDDVWYHAMNGGTAIESDQGALGAARRAEWESVKAGAAKPTPSYIGDGVVITAGTPSFSGGNITNIKQLTFAKNTGASTVQNYLSGNGLASNFDEFYTISRTYAKLREVQIAYMIPKKVLGKTLIKTASVSLVGRNLLYFAKRKDFDIDQYAAGYNAADNSTQGTSGDVTLSSPTQRRYGINLNLGF